MKLDNKNIKYPSGDLLYTDINLIIIERIWYYEKDNSWFNRCSNSYSSSTICFSKKDDEVIVQINDLKTELGTSTHQNIINAGYTRMDNKDNVNLYNQKPGINLYTMEQNVKNNSVMAIGLTINDNITTLKIGDYDLLKMNKEELSKEFDLIEIVDLVKFVYEDDYFVCLNYQDNKLVDFVITYNVNGNMSVRGTEIFYEEYKQQWQDEIENIW